MELPPHDLDEQRRELRMRHVVILSKTRRLLQRLAKASAQNVAQMEKIRQVIGRTMSMGTGARLSGDG